MVKRISNSSPEHLPLHPHNALLQVWVELGRELYGRAWCRLRQDRFPGRRARRRGERNARDHNCARPAKHYKPKQDYSDLADQRPPPSSDRGATNATVPSASQPVANHHFCQNPKLSDAIQKKVTRLPIAAAASIVPPPNLAIQSRPDFCSSVRTG